MVCRRLGGAFGGKSSRCLPPAAAAAVAATVLKKPVRYVLNRNDDMRQNQGVLLLIDMKEMLCYLFLAVAATVLKNSKGCTVDRTDNVWQNRDAAWNKDFILELWLLISVPVFHKTSFPEGQGVFAQHGMVRFCRPAGIVKVAQTLLTMR